MQATNYSDFRKNMKSYMDIVSEDFEPVIVTRKDNKNVVILSEAEYENLKENQYVLGNPVNKAWLDESKRQLEMGKGKIREVIEDNE
ncbi:type II toxin-antitoxin system prevent-host-death family antitoxin [Enterococcus sp. 669A]|uniref:Antitoxin n=1 Tax=Candidatus Enterococcus moelleringii TaxID=2815325 RepID=A0ABS3LEP6_9ENTE|nr:type II toxin-antitoxin system prevent-host-death family antitoxin [Enterococcus sp. 669A]MBO1308109.1 type II toxin-antitoxin system prevent-host-death family antitoxin [Enterococcus sp. 669A]